jgi:type II secretory pathway pseudopilin PulG
LVFHGRIAHDSFAARIARDESGFTLIELLFSFVLLTLVLAAASISLITSQTVASDGIEQQNSIQEAETGLYRMTRELRQGQVPAGGTLPTTAGYHACVRYTTTSLAVRPGPGCVSCIGLTAETVIDRLVNGVSPGANGTAIFTPNSASTPTRYDVTIQVPAKGAKRSGSMATVAFDDAIYLRNAPGPLAAVGGKYEGGQ